MKQTYLYLWYPLFQLQWDRSYAINEITKPVHVCLLQDEDWYIVMADRFILEGGIVFFTTNSLLNHYGHILFATLLHTWIINT